MSEPCWRQTSVSGPGQNSSTSVRAHGGTVSASASRVVAADTSTGGGISRPRPLACRRRRTASWENASAAMP